MLSVAPVCLAEFTGEFLLFPQLDSAHRAGLDSNSTFDQDDQKAGVDFFITFEVGSFRFLGEYLLFNDEQDFERFQVGWSYKNNLFWLGRFHNPISYWSSSYHHGAYLQTSISRPAIVEFEEHGGILPTHLAGLLVEGVFDFGLREFGYALALGSGPEFNQILESWEPLNPGAVSGDTGVSLNLYRDFGPGTPSRVGLFFNHTQIPSTFIGIDEIQQFSTGLYTDWEFSRWRWHGSTFYIHNQLERLDGSEKSAFFNAFLQTDYSLDQHWTFYGRIEQTVSDEGDAYLALFPEFVEDRVLGGIRYDFTHSNALKFELSANHVRKDNFTQFMLQWSAMF